MRRCKALGDAVLQYTFQSLLTKDLELLILSLVITSCQRCSAGKERGRNVELRAGRLSGDGAMRMRKVHLFGVSGILMDQARSVENDTA